MWIFKCKLLNRKIVWRKNSRERSTKSDYGGQNELSQEIISYGGQNLVKLASKNLLFNTNSALQVVQVWLDPTSCSCSIPPHKFHEQLWIHMDEVIWCTSIPKTIFFKTLNQGKSIRFQNPKNN